MLESVVTDLSLLLNKLNEGFIALAAQLQVVHEAVKVFAAEEISFSVVRLLLFML